MSDWVDIEVGKGGIKARGRARHVITTIAVVTVAVGNIIFEIKVEVAQALASYMLSALAVCIVAVLFLQKYYR